MNPSRIARIDTLHLDSQKSEIRDSSWERIFDSAISSLTLIALSPLILAIIALIKLLSPGPVLFKQRRIGYQGQPFMIYKFRTMHMNACTAAHENHTAQLIKSNQPMTKMDAAGDKRLIPFGHLLRKSGIDELPQLINVLKGEMSIAGPRPCLPSERAAYSPEQAKRFDTLPGLTGLWQVSGKNRLTFEQMVELDLSYAREKTLWMYLGILLKTPLVLMRQVLESSSASNIEALSNVRPLAQVNQANKAAS